MDQQIFLTIAAGQYDLAAVQHAEDLAEATVMTMQKHSTRLVKWGAMEAQIDEDIADLILNLWKLNIPTVLSCQNNVPENYVWLMFPDSWEAEHFLTLVADGEDTDENNPDSIFSRMSEFEADDKWLYAAVQEYYPGHGFIVAISVRFPRSDLKYVEEKIEQALGPVVSR